MLFLIKMYIIPQFGQDSIDFSMDIELRFFIFPFFHSCAFPSLLYMSSVLLRQLCIELVLN